MEIQGKNMAIVKQNEKKKLETHTKTPNVHVARKTATNQ